MTKDNSKNMKDKAQKAPKKVSLKSKDLKNADLKNTDKITSSKIKTNNNNNKESIKVKQPSADSKNADAKTKTEVKVDLKNLKFKTTKDIPITKLMIDQVIGQEDAVNVIKKAAQQRRHVLLIGEPGTGKSMLGMALAELLPKEKLVDVLALPNPNDENQPLIRTIAAGKGREVVSRAKLENGGAFKTQNIIVLILAILAMIVPWWVRSYYKSDIMFAAFFLGGMMFLVGFVIFMNVGKKMMATGGEGTPKVIVDNFDKQSVTFYDATGAHAGALLGDVLHDPFQCFFAEQSLHIISSNGISAKKINTQIDSLMNKHKDSITRNKDNYEAVHLPRNELYVLGENNGSAVPVEVLSSNRHEYTGKMIKLTTSENKELIVTQKHKVAVRINGNTVFVEAGKLSENDEIICKSDDVLIDEQNIINTYSIDQQELAKSYYDYRELKTQNPLWGYKRIATKLGFSYGRSRWWSDNDSAPVPIQTAEWLKKQGLLPLTIDNPKLPLIAKVLGSTFGDGGIFDNLNGIFLSSSEKSSVEEFGRDIGEIFGLEKEENSRIIEGGEYGHSWCYQNTNRNIIRFFLALGAPRGNKTKIDLQIPEWIFLSDKCADEFFGSLFGSELGVPKVHKQKNRLQTLDFGITGNIKQHENRILFLDSINKYLNSKGIKTTSVYKGKTMNPELSIYRLMISIKLENVMNFSKNIKINYCHHKREKLINAINEFMGLKNKKYHELISRGYGAEHAMKVLNISPSVLYQILNEKYKMESEAI